jgi:uncharacterized protein
MLELTAEQVRVLGCLVEKALTTPEQYPLTTNALVLACNQKSNRDPVVDYSERTVDQAMLGLRELGLARTVTGGGRTNKHRHIVGEALGLDAGEVAVLSVLMLRGAQTIGELRTRTERSHGFGSLDEVEAALASLAARPEPLAVQLDRLPGHKEARWAHLLSGDEGVALQEAAAASPGVERAPRSSPLGDEVAELKAKVALLEVNVARLYELLGEEPAE